MVYKIVAYSIIQMIIIFALIHSILSVSLPLHNGIYSASGSYTATIKVGIPPRQFQVQIDTGSNELAIPCIGCDTCHIQNALFDYTNSITYSAIPCVNRSLTCDDCQISAFGQNICLLNITYYDNSSITGRFIQDSFTVGILQPIQTEVGCIIQQNSAMTSFGVEGIWGVAKSTVDHNGTAYRTDQLIVEISKQQGSSERILGLCLSGNGGWMNIGKIDESLHTQPGVIIPYDNPMVDTITTSLQSISLGRFSITSNGSQLSGLIIDSGATISFLSLDIYNNITKAINSYCSQMPRLCKSVIKGESQCYFLSNPLLAYMRFPPISLKFKGSDVLWYSQEYLAVNYSNRSLLCLTFNYKEKEGGFILGNDFMLNKDIIYGQNNITIYPKSKCNGLPIRYAYNPPRKRLLTSHQEPHQIYLQINDDHFQ